jgi:isopenicillin-N N-acyltransferase-like protein
MAASVRANIATYLARFESGGLAPDRADVLARAWEPVYAREAPEYHAEMVGIAEGAGVALNAVVMLNTRYELTYRLMFDDANGGGILLEPDGCTSFGVLPGAASGGTTYVGQNWDWLAAVQNHTFLMRVTRAGMPSFLGFTEAGIAGCKMGLNEAGIGFVVNGLLTSGDDGERMTRPFHVRCRDILDAERFDHAMAAMISGKRTGSANVLLGHADGEIVDIEATPDFCSYIHPKNGLITHANHLESEQRVESIFERLGAHTLYRSPRLRRLLEARRGSLDVSSIGECLADHFGRPASICRHIDPDVPAPRQVMTVCTMIMDLAARRMHVAAGPICESELTPIGL